MPGSRGSVRSGRSGRWRNRSAARWLAAAVLLAPAFPGAAPAAAAAAGTRAGAAAGGRTGAPAAARPAAGATARFASVPGPYAIEAMDLDWFDRDRKRQVPARIYFPRRDPGPFPVVVFSSGLGAGRNSFEFLGRHLASHGYVSVHVQHAGSDGQAAKAGGGREALLKAARDPQTGLTRLLDLVFALDQLGALAASSPVLHGRIDLGAVAVGGPNVGAWTALAAAGLAFTGPDGEESSLPDPRVKAALLFVPPPPPAARRDKLRFAHVKVPCLHVVGAVAGGGESAPQAAARRIAFDQIAGADQVLVTVIVPAEAASAAAAAGGAARGILAGEAIQDRLKVLSTAFLDAYLRHDGAAKSWLSSGGLASYLGDGFRVETRAK